MGQEVRTDTSSAPLPTADGLKDSSRAVVETSSMLTTRERRPVRRTIEFWARSVLLEAGAIRECEQHGWMKDRADPHARERALLVARQDPPPGVSPDEAAAAIQHVLASCGDTCPECPPEDRTRQRLALRKTRSRISVTEILPSANKPSCSRQ